MQKRTLWLMGLVAAILGFGASLAFFSVFDRRTMVAEGELTSAADGARPHPTSAIPEEDSPGRRGEAMAGEPGGPTPEEIEAQIAAVIAARSAEIESKLRQAYDERIQQLKEQLNAAQDEARERDVAASSAAPMLEDPLAAIDRILGELELANVAFNAPRRMILRKAETIHLVLGLAKSIGELEQMIQAEGEKEGAAVRVSDRMEARLTGSGFAIASITPEIQAVSRHDVTQWQWQVEPRVEGPQRLHLTLSVFLNVSSTSTPRVIRTFDRVIEVDVTWQQRAKTFVAKNWQWLWAVLVVPLAGWLWRRRRRHRGAKPDIKRSEN